MDINQLKSIFINKTEKAGSVLNVRAGQLLWANVLEVKGNDLLLKIGAHIIEAKAQSYVKQGQQLRLLIQNISPQEIRLRIVNDDNTLLKPEQGIAKALGLKSNETVEEIIRQMVRLRLPLSREAVIEFSRLYARLDNVSKNIQGFADNFNANDSLRAGQEFKGQVISSTASSLVINTKFGLIKVPNNLNITQGQQLNLVVVNNNGELGLKLINKENKDGSTTNVISKETFLGNILQENTKPLKLIQLGAWLKTLNIEGDAESLIKLYNFFKGKLDKKEEALFFQFLNSRETQILGNYNIYGWPILEDGHVYLLTQNKKHTKISPEQCILVVKLTSKIAGDLWFKITYKDLFLKVEISCADEYCLGIVNGELETLELALLGSGYQNLKVTAKVEIMDSILDFIPGPSTEDINYINLQI